MTPNPSINIDFFKTPGFLDPRITFSRASTATYVGKSGTIVTAAIDQPRFEYSSSNGMHLGLLSEDQRVNYITQSENFSSAWAVTDITVSNNSTSAPDGNFTADLLIEGVSNTALMTQSVTVATANLVSGSVFLKSGPNSGTSWIKLFVGGAAVANGGAAWFNLNTGALGSNSAIGSGNSPIAAIDTYADGWYRCRISANCPGETGVSLNFHSATADGSNTRVANSTYFAWGGQLENERTGTSYIPTTTSTATRASERMAIEGANFTSVYNTSTYEGTVLVNVVFPGTFALDDNTRDIMGFSQSNAFARGAMYIGASNSVNFWTTLSTITVTGSGVTAGNNNIAFSYSGPKGTYSYRNGAPVSTSVTNYFRSVTANTAGVNAAADVILLSTANNKFIAGDKLFYTVPSGNTPISGLSGNSNYYVSFSNSTVFALSATLGGANIDLTEARTTAIGETHTFNHSVLPAVDRFYLGALWNWSTSSGLNGHFKRFAYFPVALSNTQATYVTSI
jgi:hypothetical protein